MIGLCPGAKYPLEQNVAGQEELGGEATQKHHGAYLIKQTSQLNLF